MQQAKRRHVLLAAVLLNGGCHERFTVLQGTHVFSLSISRCTKRKEIPINGLSLHFFQDQSSSNESSNPIPATSHGQAPDESIDKTRQLTQEAEELRRKAKTIMAEALEMEADMKEAMAQREHRRKSDSALLVKRIFETGRPLTPDATAYSLRNARISIDQAMGMAEHLFYRLWDIDTVLAMSSGKEVHVDSSTGTEEVQSEDSEEAQLIFKRIDCLIEGADILDKTSIGEVKGQWPGRVAPSLRSHLNQVRLAHLANLDLAAKKAANDAKQKEREDAEHEADGGEDDEANDLEEDSANKETPLISYFEWVRIPRRLRRLWIAEPSINHSICETDIAVIQSHILAGTSFTWNSTDTIASTAAIFRGELDYGPNLKARESNSSHVAMRIDAHDNVTSKLFDELNRRMEIQGLNKRVTLFLLNDPRQSVWADLLSNKDGKDIPIHSNPVIMAVPNSVTPGVRPRNLMVGALRQFLFALPIISLFHFSVKSYALNPSFFHTVVRMQEGKGLVKCLPIMMGIVAIQAIHEGAHLFVAKRKGIRLALPFPIPSFELGVFGCITGLKSFPATRNDLFDFAISGPVASAVSSLACMLLGLHRTLHASSQALASFPTLPVAWFKSSFISGVVLSLFAPKVLTLPLSQPIPIHPLFVVGFSGLLSSALNMLPVARLDGGRTCTAALGSKYGQLATLATFLCTLIAIFSKESASTLLVSWMMYILLFQRRAEVPSRDDVTEINNIRLQGWICSVIFSILTLTPFPGYKGLAPINL